MNLGNLLKKIVDKISLASAKDWTYVGTATGNNRVYLPSTDWEEVFIDFRFGLNASYGFSVILLKDNLASNDGDVGSRFLDGIYSSSNDYHGVAYSATLNGGVFLVKWTYTGRDALSSSYFKVYVRGGYKLKCSLGLRRCFA